MATQVAEAEAFLSSLFKDKADDSLMQLWHKGEKKSYYYKAVHAAASRAVSLEKDVYICAGLANKDYGKNKRATREQIVGIPGIWLDIDVNGGPENKRGAAPTVEDAFSLAVSVVAPTIIINSGYGLQAWWLFDEVWQFGSKAEQERAAMLVAGFQLTYHAAAKERGYKLDSTHDLARLMRVPGTLNAKGGATAPVTGYGEHVAEQDGPRYDVATLSEHAQSVTMSGLTMNVSRDVTVGLDFAANPPAEKLDAMLENSDAFKRAWQKTRQDDTAKSWSQSEWDLSIASMAAYAHWEDQEIVNLLVAYRRKWGEDLKNEQYYAKTVGIAHRRGELSAEREAKQLEQAEALDELAQIESSENGTPDPDHVCAAFSKAVGGPKVKEIVQSNRDPRNAVLRLVLANGEEVPIGPMKDLLNPDRFAENFATVTGHVPPTIKRGDWRVACGALLKARVLRDVDITTTESEVRSWLRSYMALLTPDHNEAATRRDPFEKNGELWVAPRSFADYVIRHLRKRVTVAEIEEVLSSIGFEYKLKSFLDTERDVRTSTKDYYCALRAVLDEPDEAAADDA